METSKTIGVRSKRSSKVTLSQQNVMVDFVNKNKRMQIKGDNLAAWQELSNIVNEMHGATKTAEQWRRSFIEWKSKTKKKARDISISQTKTGGGPGGLPELTDMELRLIDACGKVSVLGDSDIPEGGLLELKTETSQPLQSLENREMKEEMRVEEEISVSPFEEMIYIINTDENLPSTSGKPQKDKPVPVQKDIPTHFNRKTKTRNCFRKKGGITDALKEYSSSTQTFSNSIDNLSVSINRLADSNFAIAEALRDK